MFFSVIWTVLPSVQPRKIS